ncbi:MAG: hypothetical protein QXF56_01250 [Candidatus Micrarchaeia archaeon]
MLKEEATNVKTSRYSFKDERYFYYLVKSRFHEVEQKAWMEIGRVIKERGSIDRVDAGLIFFGNVKDEDETLKRNFAKRMKYLVDNGALNEEEVYEKIPKEKLKKYRLE